MSYSVVLNNGLIGEVSQMMYMFTVFYTGYLCYKLGQLIYRYDYLLKKN